MSDFEKFSETNPGGTMVGGLMTLLRWNGEEGKNILSAACDASEDLANTRRDEMDAYLPTNMEAHTRKRTASPSVSPQPAEQRERPTASPIPVPERLSQGNFESKMEAALSEKLKLADGRDFQLPAETEIWTSCFFRKNTESRKVKIWQDAMTAAADYATTVWNRQPQQLRCSGCGEFFPSLDNTHRRTCASAKCMRADGKSPKIAFLALARCDVCEPQSWKPPTMKKSRLTEHVTSRHFQPVYKCSHCGEKFGRKASAQQHDESQTDCRYIKIPVGVSGGIVYAYENRMTFWKLIDEADKKWRTYEACGCNDQEETFNDFAKHWVSAHTSEQVYECDCRLTFNNFPDVESHVSICQVPPVVKV
eukprot:Polyplicarium_translucidae@DN2912_c0_g3_i1.p1